MRKPAPILLTGLLVSVCGLWAQQSSVPQNRPKQNSSHSEQQSEPTTTLRVDVNLINVFVTVTDARGAPIGGLKKENFILKEDDREQKIAVFDKESAVPLSIALAIDTSLSTRHDLPLEQASAKRFAHAILRPVDAVSVYGFSEVVHESTPGYTSDLKRIDEGIARWGCPAEVEALRRRRRKRFRDQRQGGRRGMRLGAERSIRTAPGSRMGSASS